MLKSVLLKVFYETMRVLILISLRLYFPYTHIQGRNHLRYPKGAIVATNHPNTMVDVVNTAMRIRQHLYFLANASLFKHPFTNWFFNTFFCIPIERYYDTQGKALSNAQNFARCDAHLLAGGSLYVAPEGTSERLWRLLPIKTGTARIALSAEQKTDFNLTLPIIPVGYTYHTPGRFRSRMYMNVGQPLYVTHLKELYQKDPIAATRQATAELKEAMMPLVIHAETIEEEHMLRIVDQLWDDSRQAKGNIRFNRLKNLETTLRNNPERQQKIIALTHQYAQTLQQYGIANKEVVKGKTNLVGIIVKGLGFGFGLPVFGFGAFNHILPAGLPDWLSRKITPWLVYESTIILAFSLFSFPIFYALQAWAVKNWFGAPWHWLYLVSLPLAGVFAWEYKEAFKRWKQSIKARRLQQQNPRQWNVIRTLQAQIDREIGDF